MCGGSWSSAAAVRASRRSPSVSVPHWTCRALPAVLAAIGEHAGGAAVHLLRGPTDVERFLAAAS